MTGKVSYLNNILICCLVAVLFHSCKNSDSANGNGGDVSPQVQNAIERATQQFDAGERSQAIEGLKTAVNSIGYLNTQDRFEYYNFLYDHYNRSNEHRKAGLYIDSMLFLIEQTDNIDNMASEYAEANYYKGDMLFEEGLYNDAYKFYFKAKTIAKNNSDSCRLSYYNYRIGMVLYKDEQYANAIRFFRQSFDESASCANDFSYFIRKQELLDNIGLAYSKLNKPDSAIAYYGRALYVLDTGCKGFAKTKVRQCNIAQAVIWGNLASAYNAQGMADTAEYLLLKSIEINSQSGYDLNDAQTTRLKLANLYLGQGRYEEMNHILAGLTQHDMDNKEVVAGYHRTLWQYYNRVNQPVAAYGHIIKYVNITDSLRNANKNILLRDIGEGVASLEKQYQIDNLSKSNEIRNIYLLIAVVGVAMSLIIIAQLVITRKKSKRNLALLTSMNTHVKEQKLKMEMVLAELQKAGEEKDRILKAVSHDLRSPVNIALSLTELILSEQENLSPDQLEYVELIRTSCTNALTLTKELLDVASLNTELMLKEWVDVNEIVSKNVEVLRFRAAEKNQRISLQLADKSLKLKINRDKVSRVVGNLINNAIKFSPEKTLIHIKVMPERQGATISVTDHGIGIPENLKDKVFDLFTEAKRLGTSGEEPYGLGLSISKQIIDVHGGKIWFDTQVGKGTTFYVYLPDQYNSYVRTV